MAVNRKKLQRTLAVIESSFLFFVLFCLNFCMQVLEKGGRFALVLIPVFDTIHAERYWTQSQHVKDPPLKIILNKLYYGGKVLVNGLGAALAMVGGFLGNMLLLEVGFGLMVGMGLIGVGRNLLKMRLNEHNPQKVNNNAVKAMVGLLISVGFFLMTFVPELTFIPGLSLTLGNLGGLFAGAAASFIFIATAPPALADTPVKAKNQQEFVMSDEVVFSDNYEMNHENPTCLMYFNSLYVSKKPEDEVQANSPYPNYYPPTPFHTYFKN